MILITGATGMLGGHLIRQLLCENKQVAAIKRTTSNAESLKRIFMFYGDDPEAFYDRIVWRDADVEDYESLCKALEGIEYVYHCAAMVSLGKSNRQMLPVNVGGTKNVVDAALANKVSKLCFVSSIAALPDGNGTNPINEETPFSKNERTTLYGESKRLAEKEIQPGIQKGLKAVIVNPGVILGYTPNCSGSGELFKRVKKGLPFYTKGQTGYIAVEDVVKAMMLLMKSQSNNQRFVLVGENCRHKDILQCMADGFGKFRPFIGMNKTLLLSAHVLEITGKLVGFTPLIDTSSAKVAVSQKTYSAEKFLSLFPDFQFTNIRDSILAICEFDKEGI